MTTPDLAERIAAITPLWWAVGGFALGAIVGSHLATLATRWPAGASATAGRSRCAGCGAALGAVDLVPLLSFVALRGRCRRCGATIDSRLAMIELAAALIGAASFWAQPGLPGLAGAIFGWLLLLLAVLDVEHFWLPDRLTLPLAVLGIAESLLAAPSLIDRAIGAVAGFAALAAIALAYRGITRRSGLGAGDTKLLAAIGAWLGWQLLPLAVLAACVVGFAGLAARIARGEAIARDTRLPLGALLAIAAWPLWLMRETLGKAIGV